MYDNYRHTQSSVPIRIVTCVLVLIHMILFTTITSQGVPAEERCTYQILYWLFAILFVISFIRASIAPLREIPDINAVIQDEFWEQWAAWKPRRARHCATCEKWVLKMDHHCPFLGTWVGYHNLKFFILFWFYGLIVNYIYLDSAIRYGFSDEKKLYFPVRMFYWLFTGMFTLSQLNFLMFNINSFVILYNNTTAADTYEETELNYPWWKRGLEKSKYIEDSRNAYDRLWLWNFWDILGDSLWQWPLPIFHEMKGKGMYYPSIPDFDMKDLQLLNENKPNKTDQTMEMSDEKDSWTQYAQALWIKYRGKVMEFNGEHFELPKMGEENNKPDSD